MKRKAMKWLRFGLLTVLALSLAGATLADGTAGTEFVPRLDTGTACTITVAGHYSNFEALETEFNLFRQYYPNVNMEYIQLDDYNAIIGTALLSSEAPDIYFAFHWMDTREDCRTVFESAENLADPALGIDLSCIRSDLLYTDEAGAVLIVPIYTTTYGMLVNEAIFEKEGLAIPRTYPELVDTCKALKQAGYANPIMGYNRGSFLLYPMYFPYFCAQIQGNPDAVRELNEMQPSAGEYMRSALEISADFMSYGFIDLESCNLLENDYNAVIMRFFEGDIPMMLASGNTVSGTEKREAKSEAFTANPFPYSFHPVPSTEDGGYFLNMISLGFAVNKKSENLDMANEFMRFLIRTERLNEMAEAKRLMSPCTNMPLDGVYASFGKLDDSRVIYQTELGLQDAPDTQVRRAGWQVSNGLMTVDEAVAAFGTLE